MTKAAPAKPKRTMLGIRPTGEDFRLVELLRQKLEKMNGFSISDSMVLRYAITRAVQADQLEKSA